VDLRVSLDDLENRKFLNLPGLKLRPLGALFNSFIIYRKLNPTTKLRYKEFLLRVAKAWATDKMEAAETKSDTDLV
jgi:hypothetical protein